MPIIWVLLRDRYECEEIAEQRRMANVTVFGSMLGPWEVPLTLDEVERGTVFWDAMPLRDDG